MVDQPTSPQLPQPAQFRCPWCAAVLEPQAEAACPACGAALQAAETRSIPGVTEIDALAVTRRAPPTTTSIGGIFMGGAAVERPSADELPAIAPPDEAVRREMLRLEIEAAQAELDHEYRALEAEERLRAAEHGGVGSVADGAGPGSPAPGDHVPPAGS